MSIHHIMIRGNNRQQIFFSRDYFDHFLEILTAAIGKYKYKVVVYCLMTNHVHLVLHGLESLLPDVMQNICYRYARWVNTQLGRVGHLFQGRYRSILVQDDSYLLNLCRYVHLNPVVAKMVDSPESYYWSSHHNYLNKCAPAWICMDKLVAVIKHKTGLSYSEFMRLEPVKDDWKPSLWVNESGDLIIDDFVRRDYCVDVTTECIEKVFLSVEDVMGLLTEAFYVSVEDFSSECRDHVLCQKRAVLVYCLRKYAGLTLHDISKILKRSVGTLSRQVSKIVYSDFHNQLFLRGVELCEKAKRQAC